MKLALLVKSAWKDLPQRVDALEKRLSSMLPVGVDIVVILRDYGDIQADQNGRIKASWFKATVPHEGFDGACVLVSLADRKKYGLKPTLRGHYIRDEDGFVDFWVASDRATKREGKPQFEETFMHELAHGLYHQVGAKPTSDETVIMAGRDNVHAYHNVYKDLPRAYAEISAMWPKPKKPPAKPDPKLEGLRADVALAARRLVVAMESLGKPIQITEGFRSPERQAELYAQGRTKPGRIVTNAKPGESKHNKGLAFDVVFRERGYAAPEADWQALGMLGRSFGLSWGGYWKGPLVDRPHFEI
jgi:peptidoglycan L-alanyl-D-glutamate endopeptidase CwlK